MGTKTPDMLALFYTARDPFNPGFLVSALSLPEGEAY
jgi:hypothetical protein